MQSLIFKLSYTKPPKPCQEILALLCWPCSLRSHELHLYNRTPGRQKILLGICLRVKIGGQGLNGQVLILNVPVSGDLIRESRKDHLALVENVNVVCDPQGKGHILLRQKDGKARDLTCSMTFPNS